MKLFIGVKKLYCKMMHLLLGAGLTLTKKYVVYTYDFFITIMAK